MRGRGTIRATRIRGLAEPRRPNGGRMEVLFTKLKRGRLVTAQNHFCRDESGCEGGAGKPMTMVAASCGGPRRIESRRCSSTTCAANGSRGRGSRRSDLAVRCRAAVNAAGVRPPSRTTPVRHEPRTSAAPWGSSSWERDPSGRRTARRSPRTVHRTTWGAEPAGRRRRCRALPPTSSEETSPGSTSVDLLRS